MGVGAARRAGPRVGREAPFRHLWNTFSNVPWFKQNL